jgi:hypothetical protein
MIVVDKIDGKECVVILEAASSDEAGMTFNRVLTLTPVDGENIWEDFVALRVFGLEVVIRAGELGRAAKQADDLREEARRKIMQSIATL